MNRTESNFKQFKNRPISRLICWKCRKHDVTLINIKNDGHKGPDYVCKDCETFGRPVIGNVSQQYFKYEK